MKILWVNPSFLDYRVPVYKLLNELSGGNFYLIYSKNRIPERVISKITDALGDHAIGLSNEIVFGKAGKGDFSNTEYRVPYQPGLYEAIAAVNADIVIGEGFFQWTPVAMMFAKLKRRKMLIAYERTAYTERNCPKWRTLYRKVIAKLVDGFSVNGLLTTEYLLDLGMDKDKIFVGGMSADSENLVIGVNGYSGSERTDFKLKLGAGKGLTYLYAGQFIERKGVSFLLDAWRWHIEQYTEDTLITIGSGPLLEEFKEKYADCPSIKILGSIDYDLIYRYYAIADVFVIPTLEDNWSLVVPEAMACGLPIACSIYNGCYPELVREDINGKLFDPLKQDSVVDALGYFHGKDVILMGNNSVDIEKAYNAEAVAGKIFDSLKTVYGKSDRSVLLESNG